MFSVVIPLFNKELYIHKAITSVLEQTFTNFELIIINDGSTDRSLEEVNKFSDYRLKVISQANAGVSAARNIGVQYAHYTYIAFLDADDWWDSHFLEEMAWLIHRFPKAELYGSSYYSVKNGVNRLPNIGIPIHFKAGYIDYFEVYGKTFWVPINCSFVVISKSIFEQEKGFNEKIKFSEDFDLWARVALQSKVAYINKQLAYSNQDVDIRTRALTNKLWPKENHLIFNINDLEKSANTNYALKYLLDGLKVRSLIGYYLKGVYSEDVNRILESIDWSKQPFTYRLFYRSPPFIAHTYTIIKHLGSRIKHSLYKIVNPSIRI